MRWTHWVWSAIFIFLACLLFRVAERGDADLHVYWRAAQDLFTGQFPYRVAPEDGGFVFKYPPWILPWLSPLGRMSWPVARWSWFGLELFSLLGCFFWVKNRGASVGLTATVALAFWWIWRAHFEFGQLTLPLLAIALYAAPLESENRGGEFPLRSAMAAFFFTAKVFSVVTLLGLWPRWRKATPWLWVSLFFSGSLAILLWIAPHPGLREYFQGWLQGAVSGGQELGEIVIRGPQNHSPITRVLSLAGVPAAQTRADLAGALGLATSLSALWWRASRRLDFHESWAGWIALGVIAHPLVWDHSFVMTYPLCVLSVARARATGDRRIAGLAWLGVVLIAVLVPQLWGAELIRPIELCANKAWGVIACAAALVWAKAQSHASLETS